MLTFNVTTLPSADSSRADWISFFFKRLCSAVVADSFATSWLFSFFCFCASADSVPCAAFSFCSLFARSLDYCGGPSVKDRARTQKSEIIPGAGRVRPK